ncbi:ABC transporter substrate-binding protein [Bradyrhizobium sp. 61]|uniref:ABC transporter substrate-binding protein n=1 Tax=unclassified Bradyrhizobium TaxID=2631580 RepID=UPI001FF9343A|nr:MULTISPECIES: ABC transporter substrate-binding protein [unclassified Bradyrhizobium]MCK1274632.1 ABC transporter substrate-binding protein [Bradyrhizobium sp. 61]MCK1441626.1 ABC transporter substrate-binding protein [Bradyrhizobium sp. 48]MCK1465168.1 ABC transporter substrate-binding protein [Bradyrhizobium sp. 2]
MNEPTRRQITKALLLTSGAIAGGLAPRPIRAAEEIKRGGTLNIVIQPEPPILVSLTHTAGPTTRVSPKVTEGLLTFDLDFNPRPQLATAWQIREDGLRYRFELRRGVKWHDGRDFTSADVAYSIELLKQHHPRGRGTLSSVREVLTPDPHIAEIVLDKPAPYLLAALTASESPIVPRHIYEGSDPLANPNGRAPIGTGPFVFKEWKQGSHILLERNPNYWDPGKPYLDRVVIRFIADANARAVALETGEVHFAPDTPVPLGQIETLKANPNLVIETRGYDYQPIVYRLEFNLANPYFARPEVRRAVAHAIDREAINRVVFYGWSQNAPAAISPALKQFYNPDIPRHDFDPKKAEAILDAAGLPRGPDGTRFKVFHDYMPYSETYQQLGAYARQALANIGIGVTLRAQDVPTWFKRTYTNRDFDFMSNGMSHSFDPTVGVQRLYWSKNFKPGVPFSNGSGYSNPEVDRLLEAAAVESDPAKRRELFRAFQVIIATDLPDINLVTGANLTIASRKLRNHTATIDGPSANFADVWLEA